MVVTEITLKGLSKISLNILYSGIHWSKRVKIKNDYYWLIKSQFKGVFSKKHKYHVDYEFVYKTKPLDAMNCAISAKMIEDVIFEDDRWDIIQKITVSSRKGETDFVKITVKILENE